MCSALPRYQLTLGFSSVCAKFRRNSTDALFVDVLTFPKKIFDFDRHGDSHWSELLVETLGPRRVHETLELRFKQASQLERTGESHLHRLRQIHYPILRKIDLFIIACRSLHEP